MSNRTVTRMLVMVAAVVALVAAASPATANTPSTSTSTPCRADHLPAGAADRDG